MHKQLFLVDRWRFEINLVGKTGGHGTVPCNFEPMTRTTLKLASNATCMNLLERMDHDEFNVHQSHLHNGLFWGINPSYIHLLRDYEIVFICRARKTVLVKSVVWSKRTDSFEWVALGTSPSLDFIIWLWFKITRFISAMLGLFEKKKIILTILCHLNIYLCLTVIIVVCLIPIANKCDIGLVYIKYIYRTS